MMRMIGDVSPYMMRVRKIFVFLGIASVFVSFYPFTGSALTLSADMDAAVEKIVADMDKKVSLEGKKVLVTRDAFTEAQSTFALPFSDVLVADLSQAVTTYDGLVIHYEPWEEGPFLQLHGSYRKYKDRVVISVSVSSFADMEEQRLYFQAGFPWDGGMQELFETGCEAAIAKLVQGLVDNNRESFNFAITTRLPLPAGMNATPLALAGYLKELMALEITKSPFGDQVVATRSLYFDSYYTVTETDLIVHGALVTKKNEGISRAKVTIPKEKIPDIFFEPKDYAASKVCLSYSPEKPQDVQQNSLFAKYLLRAFHDVITKTGSKVLPETEKKQCDYSIAVSLAVHNMPGEDGIGDMNVDAVIQIMKKSNIFFAAENLSGQAKYVTATFDGLQYLVETKFRKEFEKIYSLLVLRDANTPKR